MTLEFPLDALKSSNRILVLGPSGAGKTYLTRRLSKLLRKESIHLDSYFWKTGWISTPQGEWRNVVGSLIERDQWIMDGTYESTLDLRIPAADVLILIEDRPLPCLLRVLWRRVATRAKPRPDAPPGQKIDLEFLRYIWRYSAATRPVIMDHLKRYGNGKIRLVLSGPRGVKHLIHQLECKVGRASP